MDKMYALARFDKDTGKFLGFVSAKDSAIRIYEKFESAERAKRYYDRSPKFDYRICRIGEWEISN